MNRTVFVAIVLGFVSVATANPDTNGTNGIDSIGLPGFNGQTLTGTGVKIGQVEPGRAATINTAIWICIYCPRILTPLVTQSPSQ